MMQDQEKPKNRTSTDSFEALRRANLASQALDAGNAIPAEIKRKNASKRATTANVEPELPPGHLPGFVYSQTGRPGLHIAKGGKLSETLVIKAENRLSDFERLKMGQLRLGFIEARGKDVESVKALEKDAFNDIDREANMSLIKTMIDNVSKYFRCAPAEVEAEKRRLLALPKQDLDAVIQAYEFTQHHVMVMTDDLYAKKVAREDSMDMMRFYDTHGATEVQIESARQEVRDAATSSKKANRKP